MCGRMVHPCVWTDGSLEPYPIASIAVAGAGVYLPAPEFATQGAIWGGAEEYGDVRLERCRAFMPVPGHSRRCSVVSFGGFDHGLAGLFAWSCGCG